MIELIAIIVLLLMGAGYVIYAGISKPTLLGDAPLVLKILGFVLSVFGFWLLVFPFLFLKFWQHSETLPKFLEDWIVFTLNSGHLVYRYSSPMIYSHFDGWEDVRQAISQGPLVLLDFAEVLIVGVVIFSLGMMFLFRHFKNSSGELT